MKPLESPGKSRQRYSSSSMPARSKGTSWYSPTAALLPRLARSRARRARRGHGLGAQSGDEGKVAVAPGVVEAVPDDEQVLHLEHAEVGHEGDDAARRLVQEHARAHLRRPALVELARERREGPAGVEDVVDEQQVAAADLLAGRQEG